MQLSTMITALGLTSAATLASAGSIQVNYYNDGGCSAFASTPPNVPTDGSCYGWAWTWSNSANIAGCSGFGTCVCVFYSGDGCTGSAQSTVWKGGNCASNWGTGFRSFKCWGY